MKPIIEYSKKELIKLCIESIVNKKKIVAPDIQNQLYELGFHMAVIGSQKEHEINSREVKENFHGYDIAVGLAARAISYGCGRRYYALVFNYPKNDE